MVELNVGRVPFFPAKANRLKRKESKQISKT
uniref:Uncharacterized protein n=1 Tax=Arundo donax TaxID=35708 RepID=A0A0A9ATP8_ARUDO